jgi:methylmalonyl-CoA mutase, N-terminal domain
VNAYAEPPEPVEIPIHRIDPSVEARQVGRLKAARAARDQARVARLLDRLAEAATDPAANLMGPTIEAVKARASLGEIVARLRNIWGSYVERPVF